jgi:hypothetical protein
MARPEVTGQGTDVEAAAYTVDEFAKAYRLSRAMVYKLWRAKKGPAYKRIGKKKRIITLVAADEWSRSGEVGA